MRAAILLFPGVEEMDFVGPLEVFGAARKLGCKIETTLTSPEAAVTCAHGMQLSGLAPLCDSTHCDVLVVPGGGWLGAEGTGVRAALENPALLEFIKAAKANDALLASVCTGAFLLAEAGMLKSGPSATHHSAAADLRSRGITTSDARVVDTGNVVTAGGVTSGLDLGLHLISRIFDEESAKAVETYLEYKRIGPIVVV